MPCTRYTKSVLAVQLPLVVNNDFHVTSTTNGLQPLIRGRLVTMGNRDEVNVGTCLRDLAK